MAIPEFRADGWLPEGHHAASMDEVEARFGGSPGSQRAAVMGRFKTWTAAIKGKGVDTIAVTAVNDVFVMDAWKKACAAEKLDFLADGNGEFAKALDLTFDGSGNGLGTRSKRYAMLVEDGVVKKLNIEEAPGKVEVSGGDALLKQL